MLISAKSITPIIDSVTPIFAISFVLTYFVPYAIAVGGVPNTNTKSRDTPIAATTTIFVTPAPKDDANATTIGR